MLCGAALGTCHAVDREHQRCEVTAAIEACLEVFPAFLPLLIVENLGRVALVVGGSIRVGDPDVKYGYGVWSPESVDAKVAA